MLANEVTIPRKTKKRMADMMSIPSMEANINLKKSFMIFEVV
jgi:hypothetical protein